MVTGPTTSATRITAKGPLVVFGIGLLPAGWNAIIGGSAAEMTDIVEDARAVLGTFAEDMLDILRHSPSFDNMIGIADLSMRSLVQQPRDRPLEWFIHARSEEHTSELQSLMRISYAVFCLKKKTTSRTKK